VERKVKEGTQGPLREEGRINGKQARGRRIQEGRKGREGSWTSEEGLSSRKKAEAMEQEWNTSDYYQNTPKDHKLLK